MLSCCCCGGVSSLRRSRRRRLRTNPSLDADDISGKLSLPAAGGRFILAPSARGSMAVKVLSTNLYGDFRRSMLEVVEARRGAPEAAFDWGFMEELLACYLNLNEPSMHEDILRAYTDLTTSFRFITR